VETREVKKELVPYVIGFPSLEGGCLLFYTYNPSPIENNS
jgi:hypothetical protein